MLGGRVLEGLVRRRQAEASLFDNKTISPCLGSSKQKKVGASAGAACTAQKGTCKNISSCTGTVKRGLVS